MRKWKPASDTGINIGAALNEALVSRDTCAAKTSAPCSDSGLQNDILESLTQAFVQSKEKSPAIAEKIAELIDNMATGGLSSETVKERADKCPSPENCKFLSITTVNEEIWDLLPQRTVDLAFQRVQEPIVQSLSAMSILSDQLVKDLHAEKTPNTRKILHHVMDSIALLANANFKLNMKRRELIKPHLNPPFTRLCKKDIKPSTKLFGDDLSKHVKDMAEAKKANDPVILDAIKHYHIEFVDVFPTQVCEPKQIHFSPPESVIINEEILKLLTKKLLNKLIV